jgi:hypothetical protein
MKYLILTSIVIAACSLTACSERIRQGDVPSVVQNSLMQQFKTASNIDWEKDNKNFKAEFEQDSVEYDAIINPAGTLVKYKQELTVAQLPAAIAQTLQTQYKDHQIDEVEKVGEGNQVFYQVELENNRKEVKLVFTENGAVVTNAKYWD